MNKVLKIKPSVKFLADSCTEIGDRLTEYPAAVTSGFHDLLRISEKFIRSVFLFEVCNTQILYDMDCINPFLLAIKHLHLYFLT